MESASPGCLHLVIKDEEALLTAVDYCHDGALDPAKAAYDQGTQTFRLELWRETEGEVISTRVPLLKRRISHWVRCELIFRQVESAEIRRRYPDDT